VVEDFLGLARPVAATRETCDLTEELQEVQAFLTGEATARGVRLQLELTDLPPVRGDREKLRQVFLNLALNGIQATGRGGALSSVPSCIREGRMRQPVSKLPLLTRVPVWSRLS